MLRSHRNVEFIPSATITRKCAEDTSARTRTRTRTRTRKRTRTRTHTSYHNLDFVQTVIHNFPLDGSTPTPVCTKARQTQ